MADELGSAVLRITVEDGDARQQLAALRREIETTGRTASRLSLGSTTAARPTPRQPAPTASRQSDLTSFLRDIRLREESEKRSAQIRNLGYKDSLALERALTGAVQRRSTLERTLERLRPGPEARKRAGGAISSGLIGGGFPLLFGQGVGAAVGGGVGGLAGGALGGGFGFALSIVGTAVGAAFDEALNKAKTLAEGLRDPIGQFDALRQASLLSSSALERQVEGLIASGREAEAAAQIQLDLARSYSNTEGFAAIKSEFDDLGRAFTSLGLVVAEFAAGPLTEFLDKLSAAVSLPAVKAAFEGRIENLGLGKAGRSDVLAQARTNIGSLGGLTGGQAAVKLYAEANRLIDERFGKTQAVQQAEAALGVVTARQVTLDETRLDLIRAQARGYERQALLLQRSEIELQRDQDLSRVPPEQRGAVERKAATDLLRINEQLAALDRDRYATLQLQTAELGIGAQSLQRQITNAIALAKVQTPQGISIERQELERRLQLQESIAAARDKERRIGAQIDAARIRGGDAGEQEASRLVDQQRLAAQETRLALIEGATALRDAGQQLARNLRDSVVGLAQARQDPEGLRQFLSPQAIANRDLQTFQSLLPIFRDVRDRVAAQTGERIDFTGPTADVNARIIKFIQAAQNEFVIQQQIIQTNAALNTTNQQLAKAQSELAIATAALANKDWNVQVLVNGSQQPTPLPGGGEL